MPALGETITIVNKSGKIVGTSKHLVNVFNEAKSAYNERKAELKAFRKSQWVKKDGEERKARQGLDALTLDDSSSRPPSSRRASSDAGRSRSSRHSASSSHRGSERPPIARGVSDSFYANDAPSREPRRPQQPPSPLRNEVDRSPRAGELTRRHTDGIMSANHRDSTRRVRSASLDGIDMDLAYGELPPPLPVRRHSDEVELREKMTGLQRLLDECNCLQHSVTAIVDNLSKNPDNLAAVALTLAEISNLVSKMAPGALMSMKGAFPAAVALLASPEFAIAAGAAVGVTIIALGGYKIIKKIQGRKAHEANLVFAARDARRATAPESGTSEAESLREIDRIEVWRRGIEASEAESLGSTVEGELITPRAARTLIQDGRLNEADLKSRTESDGHKKRRRKHRSSDTDKDSRTSRSSKTRPEIRVKSKREAGGLRMLFKSGNDRSSTS